ncbi:MAG: hypoxanthine phosphoribosyltransferase [Armatimonadetes bacterium]|nr:hypoxanthine phosphoribosyltransferase [Armatimonadota bacterium]
MPTVDVLLSADAIQDRIQEMATQINQDYEGETLLLVGVLKGSYLFLADLAKRLTGDVQIDFVQVSSYKGGKSTTGVVQIIKDLDVLIEGRNVLIIEDIVDTGLTLSHLLELLKTRRPKTIRIASLLRKPEALQTPLDVDYVGFDIPKEFVVGYGLDYEERFRNLPFIGIYREP